MMGRASARYALAILTVVYTFNFIDRQILAILLPPIKAEFMVDDWVLGMLHGTSFALFYATLGIPIALLGDRFSRRNLIAAALAIWSGMTALSGMATNIVDTGSLNLVNSVLQAGEWQSCPPQYGVDHPAHLLSLHSTMRSTARTDVCRIDLWIRVVNQQ